MFGLELFKGCKPRLIISSPFPAASFLFHQVSAGNGEKEMVSRGKLSYG